MNFIRTPLFVNITDIHKQITEHEHLIIVLKDKTASFSFRTLDIGTFFFAKRACSSDISDHELVASFDDPPVQLVKQEHHNAATVLALLD